MFKNKTLTILSATALALGLSACGTINEPQPAVTEVTPAVEVEETTDRFSHLGPDEYESKAEFDPEVVEVETESQPTYEANPVAEEQGRPPLSEMQRFEAFGYVGAYFDPKTSKFYACDDRGYASLPFMDEEGCSPAYGSLYQAQEAAVIGVMGEAEKAVIEGQAEAYSDDPNYVSPEPVVEPYVESYSSPAVAPYAKQNAYTQTEEFGANENYYSSPDNPALREAYGY